MNRKAYRLMVIVFSFFAFPKVGLVPSTYIRLWMGTVTFGDSLCVYCAVLPPIRADSRLRSAIASIRALVNVIKYLVLGTRYV